MSSLVPTSDAPLAEDEQQAVDQFTAMRRYIALSNEKKKIKAREKQINNELAALEPSCRSLLIEMGDEDNPGSMRLAGSTVYLYPELYARPKDGDRERTAHALKSAGMDWLVKEDFNINSLSAWVREVKRKGAEASDEERRQLASIEDYLDLTEGYSVRVRKASA